MMQVVGAWDCKLGRKTKHTGRSMISPPPTAVLGDAFTAISTPLSSIPLLFLLLSLELLSLVAGGLSISPPPPPLRWGMHSLQYPPPVSPTPLLLLLLSSEVLSLVALSFLKWQDESLSLLRVAHVISMNENVMLPKVPWWLLNFGNACWNQPPATQGMITYDLARHAAWSGGPPFPLVTSNVWRIGGNIKV
jgi:hypothetical protein